MSYVLAALGIVLLVIFHELGHFAVAKAVGMRVERFSLFFGRVAGIKIGETDYCIGAIPLGGYVKITGLNPNEEIPPEVAHRAYFRQPVWKRIAVITAGPAVNLVIAFVVFWAVLASQGPLTATKRIDTRGLRAPASRFLAPGDRIVSVDGQTGGVVRISKLISSHHCAGAPRQGCRAATAARIVVVRHGQRRAFSIHPRYDAGIARTRVGFAFAATRGSPPPVLDAAGGAGSQIGQLVALEGTAIYHIFAPQRNQRLSSIVGVYRVTQQSFAQNVTLALFLLGEISLALAVINLFPFRPLDGGHIFWALAEKLRGRAIPFAVMERAGVVGFVLILFLFAIGLSNDIGSFSGGGLPTR